MEKVSSRDGTRIAFERSGKGPPLVLVHGAAGDHTRWAPILPLLEQRFTVYAMDRRGRGESGDNPEYALEREFEDVAAVVDSIGESVNLLGHSFGALCALEASLLTESIARLVLHEPPITEVGNVPPELISRLQQRLDEGDREGLMLAFMREVVGMSEDDVETFRSQPAWPKRLESAHTLPRELGAGYRFEPALFAAMTAPTLLLLGSESMPFDAASTFEVHQALPNSRISLLQGAEHVAIYRVPELVVEEVSAFFLQPEVVSRA